MLARNFVGSKEETISTLVAAIRKRAESLYTEADKLSAGSQQLLAGAW
jgi:hypothetical protein